jgi:hypothetical protein
MNDEQNPESAEKKERDKTASKPQPPASSEPKKEAESDSPAPRKRGPSIDIGPSIGPGSDVVVTPPRHL